MEGYVAAIMKAHYGRETRIPIAESFIEIESNLVSKNPDMEKEVRSARGGYTNIGKRLDVMEKRPDMTALYDRLEAAESLLEKKLQD